MYSYVFVDVILSRMKIPFTHMVLQSVCIFSKLLSINFNSC